MEKKLAYKAYYTKLENYKKYGIVTHAIYDQIVFKKIRAMFGNRIKVVLCASAPMPKELADDFKIFLSVPVIEGLGMTELAGSAFATNLHDLTNFTAGGIIGGANTGKIKFCLNLLSKPYFYKYIKTVGEVSSEKDCILKNRIFKLIITDTPGLERI